MMDSKKIVLLIICFVAGNFSIAQQIKNDVTGNQYRAVHWGVDDGLGRERWHTSIIKDIHGFMWFGSSHGELSRFDGFNFKQYDPDKSKAGAIRSNNCQTFVEDSLHNIWIGTAMGVSRYDISADSFTNFKVYIDTAASLIGHAFPFWATSNEIFCIESDAQIIAYDIRSLKRKKLLDIKQLVQEGKIHVGMPAIASAIFDSLTNSIWMLPVNEEGLVQLSLSTGKVTNHYRPVYKVSQSGYHQKDAEAMRYDQHRNSIWINSHDGLIQFTMNDQQFHHIDALNPLVNLKEYERFVGIDIDPAGRIWLATFPKGIFIYDPAFQSVIDPLQDTAIQKDVAYGNLRIYCDRDGMVWTSFWSINGIYQLIPFAPSVHRFTANAAKPDSLSSLNIQNMVSGDQGSLWIGTHDEGLNIFSPATQSFKVLKEKNLPGIKAKGIVPMFVDTARKKAWLNAGPPDRVYEMDMETQQCKLVIFKDTANNIIAPVNIINNISRPYKNGFLFLDAGYGIFELTGDDLVARLVIPISNTLIVRMVIGEGNKLFLRVLLSRQSLVYYNTNGKWIQTRHLLDSVHWTEMYYDKTDSTYWLGVHKELVHYDKYWRKIRSYTNEDGLIGDPFTIIPDGRGNIWFNNDRKFIASLNTKTGIIATLSEQDGYQKQSFDWASPQGKEAGGYIYFIGNPLAQGKIGVDWVSPDKFVNSPPSQVYLKSLQINQQDFPLSIGVNNLQKLSLRYFENKISIETGVINFYSKGKSHIRYKLEAQDKNEAWEYAPAYYTIRYEDLKPGNYKLVLQASNAANEFNGPVTSLLITISPAFWNTWWFRMVAILFAAVLLYGYIQYRSRNLKQRNIVLEEKVMQRTNELHSSLAELKTTQDQLIQSEKMASLGELTSGIAHEIKNPLNFINNFSEINMELITEIEEEQIPMLNETGKDEITESIKTLKKKFRKNKSPW